jgi:hypothetical protein
MAGKVVQNIEFSEGFSTSSFKLMELPVSILEDIKVGAR